MSKDPKLKRIHDAYTRGFGSIKPDNIPWTNALNKAIEIAEHFANQYTVDFGEALKPNPYLKLPMQYVDGAQVAVPYQMILCLETTWAELDYQASELERVAKDIKDDLYRTRMLQTIEELKKEIERKRKLRLVP